MTNLLSMEKILKVYPNGVVANRYVDFELKEGEIHALAGENGAGKSTLMKMLFGMEEPSEGKIIYKGKELVLKSPMDAISNGIGMVHQHFMLVPSLSIAENIVLGMEPKHRGFFNMEEAVKITADLAKQYHFDINPRDKVEDVSVGTKQKVEILKALHRGAQLLILDEPTAVLTPQETEELFNELILLKEKGHTIVFISHKLNEIKEICDRITIMRKGESVGVYQVSDVTKEDISNLMVGKAMDWNLNKTKAQPKETLLKVKNAVKINKHEKIVVNEVSFSLRSGEILGIVGVEGNGQQELIEGITGYNSLDMGSVDYKGKAIESYSIKEIRQEGISYIPEDRMTVGIAKNLSIRDNLISTYVDKKDFSRKGVLKEKQIGRWSNDKVDEFKVLTTDINTTIGSLSGGNIQKVVVARELSSGGDVIIADQPTRGIDIGAAKFIHKKLIELRDEGAGILLVSADLTEVLDLSDSLIVMYNGEIVAYIKDTEGVTEKDLGLYMLGIKRQSEEEIRECLYE